MTGAPANSRIVVGVDGSPSSQNALGWAVRQAQMTGASLEVLMTWHWPDGWGAAVPSGYNPMDDAAKILEQILQPVRDIHPTVPIAGSLSEGHAAVALTNASRGADLLVVGSRGHGAFAGMLLGSVSRYCATHAHCPVLVFRELPAEAGAQQIVVGVDGAEPSLHALEWAVHQAGSTGATVLAISTWSAGGYEPPASSEGALESLVAPFRSTHPDLDIRIQVVEGPPARVLLEASRGAVLLVVGNRGHGAFTGMLLGSVSEHCVAHAHCPVLVFRKRE